MKPFTRLPIRCVYCTHLPPRPLIRPRLIPTLIHRPFATSPRDPKAPDNSSTSTPADSESSVSEADPKSSTTSSQHLQPPPPPRAYKSKDQEWEYTPATSADWDHIESKIDPVPELEWSESDAPVPLNRDFPITPSDFATLPPKDKARLFNEEARRIQLETIRKAKMHDHKHLHPAGERLKMPMVAPYLGYAPVGDGPPPEKVVPWQMRAPWSWIRPVSLSLVIVSLFAGGALYLSRHREEYELQALETAAPAPEDWSLEARHYYALSLKHKKAREFQHAIWALQRGLVEAGYKWVLEPQVVPVLERKPIDLENAKLIRQMVIWEIDLEHWDKALALMPALASAFREETPENRIQRADLLRIMALPTEHIHGPETAAMMYKDALAYLDFTLPKRRKERIVLPDDMTGNPVLLRTLDEYVVFQLRNGLCKPKEVLPTLVSIAHVYQNTAFQTRDMCSEGLVMLHIGEIMFALGKEPESFEWTMRAVEAARLGMTTRISSDEVRARCTECLGMGSTSLGILLEQRGDFERAVDAFRGAVDTFMYTKNAGDIARATNHLQRVSRKMRAENDRIAIHGAPPSLSSAEEAN